MIIFKVGRDRRSRISKIKSDLGLWRRLPSRNYGGKFCRECKVSSDVHNELGNICAINVIIVG